MAGKGMAQAKQVRPSHKRGPMATTGAPAKKVRPEHLVETPTGEWVSGVVKSYNPSKGFGFVTNTGANGDVFFMKTALPALQRDTQGLEGVAVSCELVTLPD